MRSLFSRRDFLRNSAGLVGLMAGGDILKAAQDRGAPAAAPRGANERLNVAVIGVRGRGVDHITGFAGRHNCVVSHMCDCDTNVASRALQAARNGQNFDPTFVQDLRRIMDNRDIHIVSIATPNHWHALAAIWAMQAGKDVYVEKPVSHNVSEGRRIVEVARRTGKICQTGTQIRSTTGTRQAIEFIQGGGLGRVQIARGLCYKRRTSIGHVQGVQQPPATCDYNLWCGPAPQAPLRRQRLHYDWHWVWDTGNGDLGNQGIHQMDVARWGLGKNEMPRSVWSVGGRFGYVDDGETANTQLCFFDYGDAKLIFEVRGLETQAYRGAMVGNVFHCADGYLVCDGYSTATAYRPDGEVVRRFRGDGDHYANFVEAVRTRQREGLHADIEEGHLSSALCHLGNISYRLGGPTAFDARVQAFDNDADARTTMTFMEEHLGDRHVPLESTNYVLGRRLTLRRGEETFENNSEADRMLTREYRRGFEVPARA
ncbi:MAG: Gfo/Idh/MocA family oxidoreductase [Planctomycetes bacterium]|nr:Gfo/Idh/MocA family oxidoreductase [Planctomycetota bacterium]